jgi:hypothetical protein
LRTGGIRSDGGKVLDQTLFEVRSGRVCGFRELAGGLLTRRAKRTRGSAEIKGIAIRAGRLPDPALHMTMGMPRPSGLNRPKHPSVEAAQPDPRPLRPLAPGAGIPTVTWTSSPWLSDKWRTID